MYRAVIKDAEGTIVYRYNDGLQGIKSLDVLLNIIRGKESRDPMFTQPGDQLVITKELA